MALEHNKLMSWLLLNNGCLRLRLLRFCFAFVFVQCWIDRLFSASMWFDSSSHSTAFLPLAFAVCLHFTVPYRVSLFNIITIRARKCIINFFYFTTSSFINFCEFLIYISAFFPLCYLTLAGVLLLLSAFIFQYILFLFDVQLFRLSKFEPIIILFVSILLVIKRRFVFVFREIEAKTGCSCRLFLSIWCDISKFEPSKSCNFHSFRLWNCEFIWSESINGSAHQKQNCIFTFRLIFGQFSHLNVN